MTSPTLTIGARKLLALLEAVAPFAEKDGSLPVLNTVYLTSRGTHLLAIATDRYRVGIQRLVAPSGETWPEVNALIPLSTIQSIKATFRPTRGADTDIAVTFGDEDFEVEATGALLDLLAVRAKYRLAYGEFPKVTKIFIEAIERDGTPDASFAVNPKFLADFGRLGFQTALSIKASATKPIMFTDGEDFIGILMPRKPMSENTEPGAFPALEDWKPLLAPTEAKASAKKAPARKGRAA